MRISGLGNKAIISLVEGLFYFSPSLGLGYWDTCAAHALMKEVGGGLYLYPDGEEVVYPENIEETVIQKVFCMSSDVERPKKFWEILKRENIII